MRAVQRDERLTFGFFAPSFILTFLAIWLNELCVHNWASVPAASQVEMGRGFKTYLGVLCGLIPPWIILGWSAVSAESKLSMIAFCFFDIVLLGSGIFLSTQ
jgi:hypothetical protein